MGLYLKSGYIDTKWLQDQADAHGIAFIVILGPRQVGKTYGTLELMLKEKKTFLLMRRTSTEMEFICNDINNPFVKYKFTRVEVKKEGKYTAAITEKDGEDGKRIGTICALSTVAKIRGIDGTAYTDMVFDEFIPENHVTRIRNEGDAFLNAYVTFSGNRELEGQKPLRVWLLANSNNIGSPILEALNLQDTVNRMMIKGQELSVLDRRGIMVIIPKSEEIIKQRKATAIMRAAGDGSRFAAMAFDNKFAYNDDSNIKNVALREYRPLFTVLGMFTVYKHKSTGETYVSGYQSGSCTEYTDTERERVNIQRRYPNIRETYIRGKVFFSDLPVKTRFIDFFIG